MNIKIPRSFLFAIVLILTLALAEPVQAHAGEPRLEISTDRINPGGVVDVRGVGFDYEDLVTLSLESRGIVIQLGEAIADLEGIFLHIVVLPADLPNGIYNIRAKTDHHEALSPALTVQGSAILDEAGDQTGRDRSDGFPAPMPTYAPGVVQGGVSQPTSVASPAAEAAPDFHGSSMLLIGLSILLVLAAFFVFRNRAVAKS